MQDGPRTRREVAELAFTYLHMEMVASALGDVDAAAAAPSEVQRAARRLEAAGYEVGIRLIGRLTLERPRFADMLDGFTG